MKKLIVATLLLMAGLLFVGCGEDDAAPAPAAAEEIVGLDTPETITFVGGAQ